MGRWRGVAGRVALAIVMVVGVLPAVGADGAAVAQSAPVVEFGESSRYVPVAPCRLADSRSSAAGDGSVERVDDQTVRVKVVGNDRGCGVPSDAISVAVTVTVDDVPGPAGGFVTAFPSGGDRPVASMLNTSWVGETRAASTIVPVGVDGSIDVFALRAGTDVIVDVTGAFIPVTVSDAGRFIPETTPRRVFDSRPSEGGAGWQSGGTVTTLSSAALGVPVDALAVAVNVTTVDQDGPGFVSAFRSGSVRPVASMLNVSPPTVGDGIAAGAIIPLAADGAGIDVFQLMGSHLIVDVAGYFTGASAPVSSAGLFQAAEVPTRVFSTRPSDGGTGKLTAGRRAAMPDVDVLAAMAGNFTLVDPAGPSYVAMEPATVPGRVGKPSTSTVNTQQWAVSNFGIVPTGPAGITAMSPQGDVDLIVDVVGRFTLPDTPVADGVVLPEVPVEPPVPVVGDVDGDGVAEDVPIDIASPLPEITLPSGRVADVHLEEAHQLVDDFVGVAAADADGVGRRVIIEVLDPDATSAVGAQGVAVFVAPVDGLGPVDVNLQLDYREFDGLFGGDWSERLRGTVTESCVWNQPDGASGCGDDAEWVLSTNDLVDQRVSMAVTFPEVVELIGASVGSLTVGKPGEPIEPAIRTASPSTGGQVAGLFADYAGSSGNFQASSLAAQAAWSHGGSSGGFSWSYPINLPDLGRGGPSPSVSLSYSSQSVDGMTSNTSSQASAVGLGWSLDAGGYIERSYASCRSVGGSAEDLCWDGHQVRLVLGGVSSRLVPVNAEFTQWRLERDNGWRLTRHTGAPGSTGVGLADDDGEYWELLTAEGTVYRFGYGTESGEQLNSVWTVPVIGARSGDPCRDQPRDTCDQAWRWNIDKVIDPVGVSMVYTYQPETAFYGANGRPNAPRGYIRGGVVSEIRWGIPIGGTPADATHKITVGTEQRCHRLDEACVAPTPNSNRFFPDVPTDLICEASGSCKQHSPSFFTSLRITDIETSTRNTDGKWQSVDRFDLTHELLDNGDGLVRLWLRSIQRTGLNGVVRVLPPVRFESFESLLPNRADPNPRKGVADIGLHRIDTIRDELGGQLVVKYGQPDPCEGRPAAGWVENTSNCYPEWWTPTDAPSGGFGQFNVWLVDTVTQGSVAYDATFFDRDKWEDTPIVTRYGYSGGAGYRHAERRGVRFRFQTWSQYRGYPIVTTTVGDPANGGVSTTEGRYFRGLDGNRISGGGERPVTVTTSAGPTPGSEPFTFADENWLQGRMYESRTLDSSGGELAGEVMVPTVIRSETGFDLQINTQADGFVEGPLETQMLVTQDTWTRSANSAGDRYAFHGLTRRLFEDDWGLVTSTLSFGDTLVDPAVANQRCTTTVYNEDVEPLVPPVRATEIVTHANICTSAALSTVMLDYDEQGRLISENLGPGDTYGVDENGDLVKQTGADIVSSVSYNDPLFGRPTATTDPNGNTTTVVYDTTVEDDAGDGFEAVTVTDPAGLASTVTMDARGAIATSTNPRENTTRSVFDGLGRLIDVYRTAPDGVGESHVAKFTYSTPAQHKPPVEADGVQGAYVHAPASVETKSLLSTNYNAELELVSVGLIDGLGRSFQTRTVTSGNDGLQTLVAGQTFDARGLPARTFQPAPDTRPLASSAIHTASPLPTEGMFVNTVDASYDGLGRMVRSVETDAAGDTYTSTWAYDGFTTTVTPPDLAATRTTIDAYGQTRLMVNTGSGQTVQHVHDGRGLPIETGPPSSRVSSVYDKVGRLVQRTESNSGTVIMTLDNNGNLTQTVDAEGNTIATEYDVLDRPIARRDGTTNELLASFTYYPADHPHAGLAESSTSYEVGGTYTHTVTGYDAWDRPAGVRYDVEPTDGNPFSYTEIIDAYHSNGQPAKETRAALAPARAETLVTEFDDLGQPIALSGNDQYVTGTVFDPLGRVAQQTMDAGSIVTATGYTDRRQVASVTTSTVGSVVSDLRYDYEPSGLIRSIDHAATADGGTHRECFEHDTAVRLVRAYTTPVGADCGGTATLTAVGGVGPDGVGYDTSWVHNADSLLLARTRRTTANPSPGEDSSFSYGPGPAQISSDGRTGFEYDKNGSRVATANIVQQASSLQLLDAATRALDTRLTRLVHVPAGTILDVDLSTHVPAGAAAVVVNAVVVDPQGSGGGLAVFPTGQSAGTNHNAVVSRGEDAAATSTTVQTGDDGNISVRVNGTAMHVIIDVVGYYQPETTPVAAGRALPLDTPTRIYDSRDTAGPIQNRERRPIPTTGSGIPTDAVGVIATVTALNSPNNGFLSLLDPDTDAGGIPPTSSVNLAPGGVRSNQVAVGLNAAGEFTVYASNGQIAPGGAVADFAVDVVAYITGPTSAVSERGLFTPLPFGLNVISETATGPEIVDGLQVAGLAGVPPADETLLVAGTLETIATDGPSFASLYPNNIADPGTSSTNADTVNELFVTPALTAVDPDGDVVVKTSGAGVVRFNISGFYRTTIPNPAAAHDEVQPAGYTWDTEQRLIETTTNTSTGAEVTKHDYGPDGIRTAQHHPDGTTVYYLGTIEATRNTTTDDFTQVRRTTIHTGALIATTQADATGQVTSYLAANHHGTIATTITNGQAVDRFRTPYGQHRGPSPTPEVTARGFLGQYEDRSGLIYLNSRHLDPAMGTFVSVDPLVAATRQPYVYGAGSPVTFSDPSGLCVGSGCDDVYDRLFPSVEPSSPLPPADPLIPGFHPDSRPPGCDARCAGANPEDDQYSACFATNDGESCVRDGSGWGRKQVAFCVWPSRWSMCRDIVRFADEAAEIADFNQEAYGWTGRQKNAFRHAFWTSIISFNYGESTAIEITTRHEDDTPLDSLKKLRDSNADLWNNSVGALIGVRADTLGLRVDDIEYQIVSMVNCNCAGIRGTDVLVVHGLDSAGRRNPLALDLSAAH